MLVSSSHLMSVKMQRNANFPGFDGKFLDAMAESRGSCLQDRAQSLKSELSGIDEDAPHLLHPNLVRSRLSQPESEPFLVTFVSRFAIRTINGGSKGALYERNTG